MPSAQKQPLIKTLNTWWEREAESFQKLLAKSVPASIVSVENNCSIVTVKVEMNGFIFPQVRCPVGMPEWIRLPLQSGDRGVLLSADFYMGGMSGIGGGTAEPIVMANLSNGIFFPIGNTSFDESDNKNAVLISGPDGVVLRDKGNNGPGINGSSVKVSVDSEGNVTIWGFKTLTTDVAGFGQRVTHNGGNDWTVDIYDVGASVTTNHLPVHPPAIPPPS